MKLLGKFRAEDKVVDLDFKDNMNLAAISGVENPLEFWQAQQKNFIYLQMPGPSCYLSISASSVPVEATIND